MNAPLLLREVERLARERGWSRRELARTLGIDSTSLAHMWAGHRPISQPVLIQIGALFGGSAVVKNLILHYILVEAPRWYAKRRTGAAEKTFGTVPYKVRWRIRRWFARLDAIENPPRGLFLTGGDAEVLATSARFAVAEAEAQSRTIRMLKGNDRIATSRLTTAAETDILLVERVEFASESVKSFIHARSDALKPMIVTSGRALDELTDKYLARVFRAWTETVTVSAAPLRSSPRRHARR